MKKKTFTNRKFTNSKPTTQNANKMFSYNANADQLMAVSWKNYSHPTGEVKGPSYSHKRLVSQSTMLQKVKDVKLNQELASEWYQTITITFAHAFRLLLICIQFVSAEASRSEEKVFFKKEALRDLFIPSKSDLTETTTLVRNN